MRDKILDNLQVLSISGPKSRTLMDNEKSIIVLIDFVVNIWFSWRSLVSRIESLDQEECEVRQNTDQYVHFEDGIDEGGFSRASL